MSTLGCNANLKPEQSLALHKLQLNKSIIIKAADKDGNTVIIDQKDYHKMCLDILKNRQWYCPISEDCIFQFSQEFWSLTMDAPNNRIITKEV